MKLSNFKFASKLGGAMAALAIVTALSLWYVSTQLRRIDGVYSALIGHEASASLLVSRTNGRLYNLGRQSLALRDAASPTEIEKIGATVRGDQKAVHGYLDKVRMAVPALADTSNEVQALFDAAVKDYIAAEAQMLEGKRDAARKTLEDINKRSDDIRKTLYRMISSLEEGLKRASDNATVETEGTILRTVLSSALGFGAVLILALAMVVINITRPLGALASSMRELASGNLATDVPGVSRGDEVGTMGKAVLVFKENGLKARALEDEARASREAAEAERARAEAVQQAAAREQQLVVDGLAAGLSGLAQRDLTKSIAGFPESYKQLERDFNAAVDALREAMIVVASNSQNILSGSAEVSTAADDLAKRTEQQAASLEETAAALDEITATGRKAAEGATHAREVVGTAKEEAARTGEVVRKTVSAMDGIERSAQQITQIIGVIDEIAFQTNLLALNAGVEAARAGDAGRGFAVVASEVRALAQRSAEAAKEIKGLISTSSSQVAEGASLVAEAGQALERIVERVNDINKIVVDIAAGAEEQATGLSQVNTAINQMDQATQHNAAMVEESTAASHSLAQEARQLSDLISRFSLGSAAVGVTQRPGPAPRKGAQLKAVAGGKGRQTAPAAGNNSDWKEF